MMMKTLATISSVFVLMTVLSVPGPVFSEEPKAIQLPPAQTEKGKPLMQVLKDRSTGRKFSGEEIPIQVLSNLMWAAFGINRADLGKRTAPSAMNWQEIDIYVAMEAGLFLYEAEKHLLKPVMAKDIRSLTGKQPFVGKAPVNLVYVADFSEMGKADDADKVFYSAADTGFISQNVYLFCASEGLATVVRGWVDREALAKEMGLRPDQVVTLAQTVGYSKKIER
jgi:SagB-type dehydrogenase family enzyme